MVVDKFDSTLDRPTEGPAKPEDERIEVEEVGTTVDLDSSGEPNVEIVDDGGAVVGEAEQTPLVNFTSNLAEVLDEGYMQSLSNELVEKN